MTGTPDPETNGSTGPLGVIAGRGVLPALIIKACSRSGRPVFVLALEGQTDPEVVDGVPHEWSRMGAIGGALTLLKNAGCGEIVMAGGVSRPSLSSLRPDLRGARLLAKIGGKSLGDDALLKLIIAEIEGEGLSVVSVESILTDVLAGSGALGAVQPDQQAASDIARGFQVAKAIGAADIGQACVVQSGLVLAVEAIEGTDAMLKRCASLAREGPGGVMVKACKPQQDARADLPTIGPDTITNAHSAGLRGIAIEAGRTIVIERNTAVNQADKLEIFVFGVTPPDE